LITSKENAKLKLVRALQRRKERDETGLFACEGEDLCDAALAAGLDPVELLVAGENVEAELLAGVSTLAHPARAIGVFRRSDLPRGRREACLALWRVSDPGNVGTLIRSADAFGASVALSAGCADALGQKALRASAGAIFRVPLVAWDDLPGRRVALDAGGELSLADLDLAPPVTLVLGAEREGLPDDVLAACDVVASIPMPGDAESLNVAAAGAIGLYELARRASLPRPASAATASAASAAGEAATEAPGARRGGRERRTES
jgi:TrmH family RNA methyltransferase